MSTCTIARTVAAIMWWCPEFYPQSHRDRPLLVPWDQPGFYQIFASFMFDLATPCHVFSKLMGCSAPHLHCRLVLKALLPLSPVKVTCHLFVTYVFSSSACSLAVHSCSMQAIFAASLFFCSARVRAAFLVASLHFCVEELSAHVLGPTAKSNGACYSVGHFNTIS